MTKAEIWVPFKHFPDSYEISNYGKVRSVTRQISYTNHKGNEVFYTIFSQPIKISNDGTPTFRISIKDCGKTIGYYFRLEDELYEHFGKSHFFVSEYQGVHSDRDERSKYQRERRERQVKETPDKPLVAKLKKFAEEIKPKPEVNSTLLQVMQENKKLKEVINLLLGAK